MHVACQNLGTTICAVLLPRHGLIPCVLVAHRSLAVTAFLLARERVPPYRLSQPLISPPRKIRHAMCNLVGESSPCRRAYRKNNNEKERSIMINGENLARPME